MYDRMDDAFITGNASINDEEDLNITEHEYMNKEDHRDKIWMTGMLSLINKSSSLAKCPTIEHY